MSAVAISLDQLLMLVGELNDQSGQDTPRDRFRQFLATSVTALGTVRDYVNVCLAKSGPQYNRALQDLVNHAGRLMGFEVEFGRYAGVTNDIGHDGLWLADGFAIVVEVKTTDVYSVKTATLLGYIHALVDAGKVANSDAVLGLYVFGKPDADLEQLEGAIVHGGYAQRLRIATVDDVLSLAELVQEKLLTRDEALALLRPTSVRVGSVVQLLTRMAGAARPAPNGAPPHVSSPPAPYHSQPAPMPISVPVPSGTTKVKTDRLYLLTPVSGDGETTAEDTIRGLLDHGVYVFRNGTPGLKQMKPGDKIAFYETGKGAVASAEVASKPELKQVPHVKHPEKFPWAVEVVDVKYFFDAPVAIDADVRARLDAFKGRDPEAPWSWFVQGTRKINEHDFAVLTNG